MSLPGPPNPPWPLIDLVDRCAAYPLVEAVLVVGSLARGPLGPASDYDLLLVLRELPAPLRAVLTTWANRQAEIFFIPIGLPAAILARGTPLVRDSDDAFVAQWLRDGALAFDRHGRVAALQRAFRAADWIRPPEPADQYALWFKLNSYVRQLRRLVASPDPVDRLAAEFKLAQAGSELLLAESVLHGRPWQGPKHALRRLALAEPEQFAAWQGLFAAGSLPDRLARWQRLAAVILAPLGGLAPPDQPSFQLAPGTRPTHAALASVRRFWTDLLSSRISE